MSQKDIYWHNYVLKENVANIEKSLKEEFVRCGNYDLHLDILDPGNESPSIVFIHGTSAYSRFYVEFLYHMYKQGIRIIAVDLQGHGKSSGRRGHFSIEELVENIRCIITYTIDRYGDSVSVMGSSLGGILSLYTAAADDRIKSAICHNIAIFSEDTNEILTLSPLMKLMYKFLPFFTKIVPGLRLNVLNYLGVDSLTNTEISKWLMNSYIDDPFISLKYSLKALLSQTNTPLQMSLDEIQTPIMVINGEDDLLFGIDFIKKYYNRLSGKKQLEIVSGVGHFVFHEKPLTLSNTIKIWIDNLVTN